MRADEAVTAAAAGLKFERGVGGTSIEDVQEAAGVSPSQIDHYFKDKKTLVRAVIAHQTAVVLGAFESVEPRYANLHSREALRAWRDFGVRLQQENAFTGGCPIGSLGSEPAELHAMRDRGELRREADPDRLGLALLTALQGGLLLTQIRRDTVALESALDTVIDHIESLTVS